MSKAVAALVICAIVIIAVIVIVALILTLRSGSETDDEIGDFECGKRYEQTEPRFITNGSDAALGSAPWFVSIAVKRVIDGKLTEDHNCGGTIIAPEWVLTATHCIDDVNQTSKSEPFCVKNCLLIAGSIKRRPNFDYGTKHRIVQQIPSDKDYQYAHGKDIALLKVDPPFEYRKPGTEGIRAIGPVCLPDKQDEQITEKEGVVVGFGFTNDTWLHIINQPNNTRFPNSFDDIFQIPENLQTARVGIITTEECAKIPDEYVHPKVRNYTDWRDVILVPQATFCAGNRLERKDTCAGDSGGPLTVDINEKATLVGITHVGLTEYCIVDPTWYGVYTRVSHYRDWIKQVTGI